jgi:tetratricopeptide (TPR) repeat protein
VYEFVFDGCGRDDTDTVGCDPSGASTAALRMGACYRQLGDRDRAASAYTAAERIGSRVGDSYTVLKARIRQAKLTMERGNVPEAEALFEQLITATTASGFADLRAEALHQRAHVAHSRGQYQRAAVLAYEAWTETSDPLERDRVLVGLAASLQEMGQREAARDANLLLAAQARDPLARWGATINLVELAVLDRREVDFRRFRRALQGVDLPPLLQGYLHLYVGQGYYAFAQPERGRVALNHAVALAEAHGFHELLFQAESIQAAGEHGSHGADAQPPFSREIMSAIPPARS